MYHYCIDINYIKADIENNLFKTINLGKIWFYWGQLYLWFPWLSSLKSILINEVYIGPHQRMFLPILIINNCHYYPVSSYNNNYV